MYKRNYTIKNGLHGEFKNVDFHPTPKQEEIITNLRKHKYNIIRKSRQVGGTTTLLIEMIDAMLNSSGLRVAYVVPNNAMIPHIKSVLNRILDIAHIEIETNKRDYIELVNGSHVFILNEGAQKCKYEVNCNKDWVIFDEGAFMKELDILWGLAIGNDNVNVTILSTPNKHFTSFNKFYWDAVQGNNDFFITDYLWYDHPVFGVDIYWVKPNNTMKIKDNSNTKNENEVRLLEMGWSRTSAGYERHLDMFGFDKTHRNYEMDATMDVESERDWDSFHHPNATRLR